jgi:hypothetical protein
VAVRELIVRRVVVAGAIISNGYSRATVGDTGVSERT